MSVRRALLCAAILLPGASVAAQEPSSREAAVAIDRIAVPPVDQIELSVVARGLRFPWSLAFLPDAAILVTERHSGLRLIRSGRPPSALLAGGPPNVLAQADSGYLDVTLDPDFASNSFIYLAFAEGTEASNRTAIWKARLAGDRLVDGRVIFRVNVAKRGPAHPGGRLLFLPDKTLLLSVGDGFDYRDAAQDMASHLGKLLRLTRDGGVAPGNPFIGRPGIAPEIWTSGHRNIQGLAQDVATGDVWAHEHGPRGGDEINLIKPGLNYGWPSVSHGIDYDGTIITERAFAPGFEPSRFVWSPSIAPSGLALYRGSRFPDWNGRFFVGGLAARSLVRLSVGRDTNLLVEEGRMLAGLRARIRDVREGPDGHLYLLTDAEAGQLLRIER
jgi:aldose sugar dehydrogenase